MKSNPKISVIIPVYKVEPYLRQCLDSVVNQTYRNLEIILIDDGSPDNCGAICDAYAQKDSRITVIHKENRGLSAARNDGIARANGEWIAFVDSDDWCEVDYYEQLFLMMENQNVDVFCAGGNYSEYDSKTVIIHTFQNNALYCHRKEMDGLMMKVLVPNHGDLKSIGKAGLGSPWDKIYRTDFIKRYHLQFDPTARAWEDLFFNFQVFDKAQKVGGCPYIGYHYRMVATSITKGFNPQKPQINYDFVTKLYSYMEQGQPNAQIQQAIATRCFSLFRNAFQVDYFHPANTKSYREIAGEIKDMKTWPYYCSAIKSNNNQYLSTNQIIFKYLLRLPWIWPAKLAYQVKCILESRDS